MATSYRRRLEALELVRAVTRERATDAELLAFAGLNHDATDAELEAIIEAPTAEHSEGDV